MKKTILSIIFSIILAMFSTNTVFGACGVTIANPSGGITCQQGGISPSQIFPFQECPVAPGGIGQCCTTAHECPTPQSTGCDSGLGINTAIGCIPIYNITSLTAFFLRAGLGLGAGVAFLLILYSGFIISTSAGDPKRLQGGKELLGGAIGGIMLLIFSVFILRLIGVNILGVLAP